MIPIAEVAEKIGELKKRQHRRPLDFAHRLPWQQVVWSLLSCDDWRSEWGPKPTRMPREIAVICANRVGKSVLAGMSKAAHVSGRLKRWRFPGEVWSGMPTLADSVAIQRPHAERWLGYDDHPRWTPRQANAPTESLLRTKAGWIGRFKAFEQSREHWQGGKLQAVNLDEQAPDDVISEARARLIDLAGVALYTFTPLKGIRSTLYGELYEPWQRYRAKHDGAKWGEVAPGSWVITAGMRDNARSVRGWLPDEEIDRYEQKLIDAGRGLEARVRVHGEWLDISEERLIPVEQLREYSHPPAIVERVAWIDPAYSTKTSACRFSICVAGISRDGNVYVLDSHGGHLEPHEKERLTLEVLKRHGDPDTFVQRTSTDAGFRELANRALMQAGRRACVRFSPESGPVPDKVTRANQFASMVAAGQVFIRPEHVEIRKQAAVFSASYRGLCDDLDAAMGACLKLVENGAGDDSAFIERAIVQRGEDATPHPDADEWELPTGTTDLGGWD